MTGSHLYVLRWKEEITIPVVKFLVTGWRIWTTDILPALKRYPDKSWTGPNCRHSNCGGGKCWKINYELLLSYLKLNFQEGRNFYVLIEACGTLTLTKSIDRAPPMPSNSPLLFTSEMERRKFQRRKMVGWVELYLWEQGLRPQGLCAREHPLVSNPHNPSWKRLQI